jgi:hypothetical protein
MSPSHLPMKLKSAASYKYLFIHLRFKTFGHIIKYYNTLFRMALFRVYTCNVYHMCGT